MKITKTAAILTEMKATDKLGTVLVMKLNAAERIYKELMPAKIIPATE